MFGPPPSQYVDDLQREVRLTDAQRKDILALLEAQEARLQQRQTEAREVFIREQADVHDRIAALLTPAQADTYRAWVARRTPMRGGGPR